MKQNKDAAVSGANRGFTLIELLVVIAIIALLLSIIMPALNKAKVYAEEIMCKSNLHQYHLATEMYANEYNSKYPNPWKSLYKETTFPGEPQRYCRWHNPLYSLQAHPEYAGPYWPYLATTKANICPSFAKIAPKYGSAHFGSCIGAPFEPQFSYSMNGKFATTVNGRPAGRENVVSPSKTFLWAEENMWTMNDKSGASLSKYVLNDNALCADGRDAFASYHKISVAKLSAQKTSQIYDGNGMSNVLLVDGSSLYLPITESQNYYGTIR